MFCRQCEWTKDGTGCSAFGACGKSPEVSDLQDLLTGSLKALAWTARAARGKGKPDRDADRLLTRGLYATLSNVDFDPASLSALIARSVESLGRIGIPADAPDAVKDILASG
ncbi:MAG: hydroxylamine reductase, partial [Deltaproteobacteria bacterium]|nr:hydroxylamine reductase [Deltaproteobacteria bacterium]